MARVQTANYGADPTTQFQWATAGSDQFSRTRDLYYLSQALEYHDHSSTRGLAVARVADGSLTSAAYAALSVGTAALANLSVTNAKLGATSVTKDKLQSPMIQPTDDYLGGFRVAQVGGATPYSWWVTTAGVMNLSQNATLGLQMNSSGQVFVGPMVMSSYTAARFFIGQSGGATPTTLDGLRIYHGTNGAVYAGLYNDTSGNAHLFASGFSDFYMPFGSKGWIPNTHNDHVLGDASHYWFSAHINTANVVALVASGALSGASLALSAGITCTTLSCTSIACTTINTQNNGITMGAGGITGATGAFTGAVSCAGLTCTSVACSGTISCTGITCTTINTQNNAINAGTGTITSGAITASGSITTGGNALPAVDNGSNCGINGQAWFGVNTHTAAKDGGGSWAVLSDVRTKKPESFSPLQYGLAEVLKLQPYWYEYTGEYGVLPGKRYVGVKAQDVQKIMPEMVTETEAKRTPESKRTTKLLSVDPSMLDWVYAIAIQELQAQIDDLKRQLDDRRN